MKKLLLLSMMVCSVALLGCVHQHEVVGDWQFDETSHWHSCATCSEPADYAAHEFDAWVIVTAATETTTGLKKHVCAVCKYEQTEEIGKLEHTHDYGLNYEADETHHWFECACGDKKLYAEHTGGTATETEQAICEVCQKPYGTLVSHECEFVDGVCRCGKTQAGAFDKTIDGDLSDWSDAEKENALKTFGETGTGFSVMGYHKDGKAYFATTIITQTVAPNSFEIFQRDGATRYIVKRDDETGKYVLNDGSEHNIAMYVTVTTQNGLNVYVIESVWDFTAFPKESNDNYKIHFAVSAPEKSAASFSDAQQEYWVLYGKNAWDPSWNFELTTTTKFGHAHILDQNFDCLICGENQKLTDLAVRLDGKIDDWGKDIVDTMLTSIDEEDRWFKQVGFTDDKYLYLFVSVSHRNPVGNMNIIVGSNHFAQIESGNVFRYNNVDDGAVVEYRDETGAFIVTDYEFVISLEKIRAFHQAAVTADGVVLGFDISNTNGENSHTFACAPEKLFMWAIAGYNSWDVSRNFLYSPTGIKHNHVWNAETGMCKLCEEEKPQSTSKITVDCSIEEWPTEVKENKLKGWYKDAENRTVGLEYMAFCDDDFIYLYTKSVTASYADKGLDIIFNKNGDLLATSLWNNAPGINVLEYKFVPNVLLENGLYLTQSEMIIDKNAYVNANNNVLLGVWFIGCDDSFEPLSWHEANKTTIWGLNHRCPWWRGTNHQLVTTKGFEHYHDLGANNICGWCQETIVLPITVDGDCSDWNADILAKARTNNNIKGTAFTDEENLYLYVEVTQVGNVEPNYLCIEGTNANQLRTKTGCGLYFDAGTTNLRPWCNGAWACAHFADCDNGYVAYAMTKTTNEEGKVVVKYELVINKFLIAKADGEVWIEVVVDDTVSWASAASLTNWNYVKVIETGFEG